MQQISFSTKNPKHLAILAGFALGILAIIVSLSSIYFRENRWNWRSPVIFRSPVTVEKIEPEIIYVEVEKEVEEEVEEASVSEELKIAKTGKISYYSHAGCLGCHPNQITASGEPFDENAMTLAIPAEWRAEIPMGTMVRVTNLDNGKSQIAKVNDTGGFLKYNRIADLSLALAQALEAKTDQSTITLEVI
jgi:rare lipoprotein A